MQHSPTLVLTIFLFAIITAQTKQSIDIHNVVRPLHFTNAIETERQG